MRDYIILNGVNSNTISGLLISTLPSISKPKIRTQTEEIDGRDGDIITKLGYSAYDKEFTIGLYGNFDINEVIEYFNSEGTVVFSNENDKYYNYQILEQIDFEKLIRFKTAKVKMHVQPFKYPTEETPVEIEYQYVTGEGTNITLDNTDNALMQLDLNPSELTQETTPTPDNPQEIQVIKGNNSIKIENKNLFDVPLDSSITSNIQYKTYRLEPNTKYTISTNTYLSNDAIANIFIDLGTSLTPSTSANGVNGSKTITTDSTGYVTIGYRNYSMQLDYSTGMYYCQLEKGTQATTYEPHQEQVLPLNLPNGIEYCKIGTYEDEFEHDGDKWYLNKYIGKVEVNSSSLDTFTNSLTNLNSVQFAKSNDDLKKVSLNRTITILCNKLSYSTRPGGTYDDSTLINKILDGGIDKYWIGLPKTITTLEEAQTYLGTLEVYYPLATPTHEEITDTTLISQLNAIEKALSYDGQTNISQTNTGLPFIISASALEKGSNTATVNNTGNIYSKPTIDIEGSGTVDIYLNNNQMFSVDLSNSNECVIDTTNLEAYNPSNSALMNRQVTGDYSNFKLNTGENAVKVNGNVTKVTITDYTRWL